MSKTYIVIKTTDVFEKKNVLDHALTDLIDRITKRHNVTKNDIVLIHDGNKRNDGNKLIVEWGRKNNIAVEARRPKWNEHDYCHCPKSIQENSWCRSAGRSRNEALVRLRPAMVVIFNSYCEGDGDIITDKFESFFYDKGMPLISIDGGSINVCSKAAHPLYPELTLR